jgi:hypothetical protein
MGDAKLLRIVREFRRGILGRRCAESMCFAVCAPLQGYLKFSGYTADLREGEVTTDEGPVNHYWLELPDGRVLDPTADQFNKYLGLALPAIYLGAPTRIHSTEQQRCHTRRTRPIRRS